jgi:hypothetical protein
MESVLREIIDPHFEVGHHVFLKREGCAEAAHTMPSHNTLYAHIADNIKKGYRDNEGGGNTGIYTWM